MKFFTVFFLLFLGCAVSRDAPNLEDFDQGIATENELVFNSGIA